MEDDARGVYHVAVVGDKLAADVAHREAEDGGVDLRLVCAAAAGLEYELARLGDCSAHGRHHDAPRRRRERPANGVLLHDGVYRRDEAQEFL